MTKMYNPTASDFFCGGGLMAIGLMQAGVRIVQSLDLSKNAIAVLRSNPHYFGHLIVQSDMKHELAFKQSHADIYSFTWPCKRYSTIADIHGARTGDELFLHAFRMVALKLPEMFVIENVPGMRKFAVVMEAFTQLPNYYVNVICPVDAANWLPQKRERLIVIATKRPFSVQAPSKSSIIPTVSQLLEKNPQVEINRSVIDRINGKYRDRPIIVNPKSDFAPTCVAHYYKDMGTRLVMDKKFPNGVRPFTVREYARLMGVPDDYKIANERKSYEILGNGVAVPVAKWIGKQAIKYFNN